MCESRPLRKRSPTARVAHDAGPCAVGWRGPDGRDWGPGVWDRARRGVHRGNRRPLTGPPAESPWDPELASAMREFGTAVMEERLLPALAERPRTGLPRRAAAE